MWIVVQNQFPVSIFDIPAMANAKRLANCAAVFFSYAITKWAWNAISSILLLAMCEWLLVCVWKLKHILFLCNRICSQKKVKTQNRKNNKTHRTVPTTHRQVELHFLKLVVISVDIYGHYLLARLSFGLFGLDGFSKWTSRIHWVFTVFLLLLLLLVFVYLQLK